MKIDIKRFSFAFLFSIAIAVISGLSYTVYRYHEYTKDLESTLLYSNELNSDKASITLAVANRPFHNLPLLIGIIILCTAVITLILYYLLDKIKRK